MVACDTLGSYGSMARFPDLNRILKVDIWNLEVLTSLSGQRHHNSGSWWRLRRFPIHRFVCLSRCDGTSISLAAGDVIKQKQIDEDCKDDGFTMKPKALHSWLTRVMYNRR